MTTEVLFVSFLQVRKFFFFFLGYTHVWLVGCLKYRARIRLLKREGLQSAFLMMLLSSVERLLLSKFALSYLALVVIT